MTNRHSDSFFDIVLDEKPHSLLAPPKPDVTQKSFYTANVRIVCCLAACLFFCISNTVLSAILPNGLPVVFLHSIGALIGFVAILALVSQLAVSYENRAFQLDSYQRTLDDAFFDSPFYDQIGARLNTNMILSVVFGGALRFSGLVLLIYALILSEGELATSVFTVFASIVMVLLLSRRENGLRAGIILKTLFLVVLAVSAALISFIIPSFYASLASLASAACFAVSVFQTKRLAKQDGLDGVSGTLLYLLFEGLVGGIIGILLTTIGSGFAGFAGSVIAFGLLAGLFSAAGLLLFNVALTTGSMSSSYTMAHMFPLIQIFVLPVSGFVLPVTVLAVTLTGLLFSFSSMKADRAETDIDELYYEKMREEQMRKLDEYEDEEEPVQMGEKNMKENEDFIERTLLKTI